MPLAFPLSQDQFLGALKISTLAMDLPEQVVLSRTGGGEVLTADLGDRLWQGTISLGSLTPNEGAQAQVLIDLLRGSGGSFLAYDTRRPAPVNDPDGSILGASAVTIGALSADLRVLALAGLPPGYLLVRGDYLGFTYSASPVCYALHRLVEQSVIAAGDGTTAAFEVIPPMPQSAAVGAAVTLVKAPCKALILPGTTNPGTQKSTIVSGQTFQFMQTRR